MQQVLSIYIDARQKHMPGTPREDSAHRQLPPASSPGIGSREPVRLRALYGQAKEANQHRSGGTALRC
jgi:hypothetical protein